MVWLFRPFFFECADNQLTNQFKKTTGLLPGKNVSISWVSEFDFFNNRGIISEVAISIYINHNWNDVMMCWKSKSGRIYDIGDDDVDCKDIEFWFEGLDPILYHKQLYPKQELPFKLKDLTYKLVVTRLVMDATLNLELKEDSLPNWKTLLNEIYGLIAKFNEKSEKLGGVYGFVHNYNGRLKGTTLVLDIDVGSAGAEFFKPLLKSLSKMEAFKRIELV